MSEEIAAAGLLDRIAALEAEIADAIMALGDAPTLREAVALVHRAQQDLIAAQRERERELTELAILQQALRLGAEADADLVADMARCHTALREIQRASGPSEMRRLAREALGEDLEL